MEAFFKFLVGSGRRKLFTSIISITATLLVARLLGKELVALVLLASIALHEGAHWLAYRLAGITAGMFFIFPIMGAVETDEHQTEGLSRLANAFISMAGLLANAGLIALGFALMQDPGWYRPGAMLIAVNSSLIVLNALPLSVLDGGHVAQAIFESTDERLDSFLAWSTTALGVVLAIGLYVTGTFEWAALLLIVGVHQTNAEDHPYAWQEEKSMHPVAAFIVAATMFALFVIGIAASHSVPQLIKLL